VPAAHRQQHNCLATFAGRLRFLAVNARPLVPG
jgi:hypothetical protein